MSVTINGSNTPTAGGVTYGDGSNYATTSAGAAGGVLYSAGSSAPAFTAAGTSGQVLTSAGSGAPTWTTPSAGALTLLSTVTASGATTADITTNIDSTYDNYVVLFSNVRPSTDADLYVTLNVGGSYSPGTGFRTVGINYYTGSSVTGASAYTSYIKLNTYALGSNVVSNANGQFWFFTPYSTSLRKTFQWTFSGASSGSTTTQVVVGSGYVEDTNAALTAVRFYTSAGTISGVFRLYGYKNS